VPSEGTDGDCHLRTDLTHLNTIEVSSIEARGHVVLIRRDDVRMLIHSNVRGAEASSTLCHIGRLMGRGAEVFKWTIKLTS
jgi:hypothetical protein